MLVRDRVYLHGSSAVLTELSPLSQAALLGALLVPMLSLPFPMTSGTVTGWYILVAAVVCSRNVARAREPAKME